ncbi:MAG TPA: hypothetical protein EYP10_12165 [Armatimonadetes bacterium]|nr:hypothetical protein [Armatimonadota bacterium]
MNAINGAGCSSSDISALDKTSAKQPVEVEGSDWFSPSLVTGGQVITATSFDRGASPDQIAQQIISHICTSQKI